MTFGRLARNVSAAIAWNSVRLGVLAATVVVMARLLGPMEYGRFVGVAGLATAAGGLSGLGLGLVMYQRTAIRPLSFGTYWRSSLRITAISSVVLSAAVVAFAPAVVEHHTSLLSLVLICLSETVLAPLLTNSAFAFAAHERTAWAAALPAVLALCRLGGAAVFGWTAASSMESYVVFHFTSTALAAVSSLILVQCLLKPRLDDTALNGKDLKDGLEFSAGWASGTALTSVDKTLALRYAGPEAAGVYGASYRLAVLAAMPVEAITQAALPRLFRSSAEAGGQSGLLKILLRVVVLYGVVAAAALYFLADLLPLVLGEAFRPTVEATRWLCLLVPFYCLRNLGGNALVARDHRLTRALVESGALGLMLVLAALLVPRHGLHGMAIVVTASEATAAAAMWAMLLWHNSTAASPTAPHSKHLRAP